MLLEPALLSRRNPASPSWSGYRSRGREASAACTHPHVLAILQRLVLVARSGDPVEAKLAEQREQDFLDQFVL
jgi:hypothetical protein